MNRFPNSPFTKIICIYLVLVMVGLIPQPRKAWASFISHKSKEIKEKDKKSLDALQKTLENQMITEKLSELGLTKEEVILRIEQLSPEERQLVLEELETVQSGGDIGEAIIVIFVVLFLIKLIVGIVASLVLLVKGVTGLPQAVREANHKIKTRTLFDRAADIDYPPYKGRVKVLIDEEPESNFIHIGTVCTNDFVFAVNKEKRTPRLLKWMKVKAAEHGAVAIAPITDEPTLTRPGNYLSWCAEAYITKDIDDGQ